MNTKVFIININNIINVVKKIFKHINNDESGDMATDPSKERAINNLLLIHVIEEANKKGQLENNLKLQKLVFLIEKNLIQRKIKAFTYQFFRWHKGPFSAGINDDLKLLSKNGLISWCNDKIILTENGKRVLDSFRELIKNNSILEKSFNPVLEKYSRVDPEKLKNHVYEMNMFVPRLRKVMPIEKIPKRMLMLFKPSDKKVVHFFEMNDDWEATLELLLNPEAIESLQQSCKDAIEGKRGEELQYSAS